MPHRDPFNTQLLRLRQWRNRPPADVSMGFLKKFFKQEIERPHSQVAAIVTLWEQHVPAALNAHCRLESFRRGVLKVAVDSSEHLYELDRLLREGLETTLQREHRGQLRRVQLVLRGTVH